MLSKAKFAPIPGRSGDNPNGQVIFSGNAATTGDTRTIYYGVKTDPYFRAGNYSTTVVYTITAELPDTPTITSVTPDSYQLEGGASGQIAIEGANLSSAYSVYLANASGGKVGGCTNLSVISDTVRKHFITIFIVDTQCKIVNIMRVVNSRRNITMKLLHK